MDRKEFLEKMALGTGAVIALSCFPGCSNKAASTKTESKGQVSIDLKDPKNTSILAAGGFIYHRGMVIAHLDDGSYVAVSNKCTHAGGRLEFQNDQQSFRCLSHGAKFDTKGQVLNGPAQVSIKVYDVILEGDNLIIKS